jgi:hypothetical protein
VCESPRVVIVTRIGVSMRMLHLFTLQNVGLSLMLRSQDAPRDVPTYVPQLFIPPLCLTSPVNGASVDLCVESYER